MNKIDVAAIEASLNSGLSTNVYEIRIPTLGRKVAFKPLTVNQVKTLAKIMIDASGKPLDTFKSVVGMIKTTCMEEIDLNELTELDRIKIMLEFYMNNNILKDFKMKCPKCDADNTVKVNLQAVVDKIDEIDIEPFVFDNGQDNKLTCTVELPKLPIMAAYYGALQEGRLEEDDLPKCFISKLDIEFQKDGVAPINLDINQVDDIVEYIEGLTIIPYVLTVNKEMEKSVYELIMDKLDEVMSSGAIDHVCECGYDFGGIADATNFI